MARLWLLTFALLVALVAAGPVKVEKRGAVSLPLRYGARKAIGRADIQRGKRSSPSSTIAQLRRQLARNKQMYGDGSVPAPFLRKRVASGSLNLTDDGYDIGYHISVQVGTPRKPHVIVHQLSLQVAHVVPKRKRSTSTLDCETNIILNIERRSD